MQTWSLPTRKIKLYIKIIRAKNMPGTVLSAFHRLLQSLQPYEIGIVARFTYREAAADQ